MSVSKNSGKLTFVVLLALAMGGCVVASGSTQEDVGAGDKIEQTGEAKSAADKGVRAETVETSSSTDSAAQTSPDPIPWFNDTPPATAEKIPLKPHVSPPRTDPYPE